MSSPFAFVNLLKKEIVLIIIYIRVSYMDLMAVLMINQLCNTHSTQKVIKTGCKPIKNIFKKSWFMPWFFVLKKMVLLVLSKQTKKPSTLVWGRPLSLFPHFILLFSYHSCVCSYLLLHLCCFHARGILCLIHTSYMGSPFPTVYNRCSPCISFFCNVFSATKDPQASYIIILCGVHTSCM